MIRYRRLYESENTDIHLYDVVRCAGYEWYVIGIEGDVVTLLAKNDDFGKSIFDEESRYYESSEIREYLNSDILPKLQKANPIPTDLPDVDCHGDEIWLLSADEAKKLPQNIRKFSRWYWLRSRAMDGDGVAIVLSISGVYICGSDVSYANNAVRPAMRVRIEDLD